MMVLRLAAFVAVALAIDGNEDVLESWWDNIVVVIWDLVADFGQIIVYFADLVVPLYNWYVTLNAQITTGTYTILAKCQIKTIIQSLVFVGEAMKHLAKAMTTFIVNPKGPLDLYDTAAALQTAVLRQEIVIKCACDGITPAFGIAFDAVRPIMLANIVNETVNALVAVPQTAVLAIPPWKEIPDGRRVFQPLKRAAVYAGKYLDEVVDNVLTRILLKPPKTIPIFSTVGYTLEGVIGLTEMLAHTTSRIILLQPITFDPQFIHKSFLNAADSFESTTLEIVTAVVEPLNLGTDAVAGAVTESSGGINNPIAQATNDLAETVDDIQASAKPLSQTIGYLLKAAIGLVMSVIDEAYFILRGEHAGLSFMEILQRWDGEFGKIDQSGVRLQEHFFQNIDAATVSAEDLFGAFAFVPISLRIASRTTNVFLRTALSAEDIIEDKFFHIPINCGYGTGEICTEECTFFYSDNAPNPCNSLISEWIFEGFEDLIDSVSDIFQRVRPQGKAWCNAKNYPSSTSRCVLSNSDFFCATSVSMRETLKVPLEQLRYAVQTALGIFSKPGDTKTIDFQDSLCGFSKVIYALSGNAISVLPQDAVSADLKEKLTNEAHAVLVLPVEIIRFDLVQANYLLSLITGNTVDWDDIQETIEDQLINSEHKRIAQTTTSTDTSIDLKDSTAQFVVTTTIIPMNYLINVFDAMGEMIGGSNFFTGLAKVVAIIKNALSKEMVNLVSLVFKVGSNLLALVTRGSTDLGDLGSDIVTLIKKGIDVIASLASQIVFSLLKMLGFVGDFLIILWRGICAAAGAIEWLTGADFGSVCDAVDTADNARRRLPAMQEHLVNMTGFDGNSECDLLVHHYNGRYWGEATYLEQVRLAHCAEQQAIMHKMNAVLRVDMPTDAIYNWKRKYNMAYEAALGFIVYMKHQSNADMLAEWDRLELPRYYLDLWHRVKIEVPWITIVDDALVQTIAPVPELSSMYNEAKDSITKMHHVMSTHDTRVQLPDLKFQEFKLGAAYHKVVSHHTKAWGLVTDIPDTPGPLNCTVADNFVKSMTAATQRLEDYYTGPFTDYALPNFMLWLQGVNRTLEFPDYKVPTLSIPSKETAQQAVLYSFQTCHYEDIRCDPEKTLERVGRITESFIYMGYAIVGIGVFSAITGLSLFPLVAFTPFIMLAHTWNYRLTCTPNIPDCFFDDTLRWIQIYQPKAWDTYFPEITNGGKCPENYLWSSAYLIAQSPLNKLFEFVLYQNEEAYNTYIDWATPSDLKDECLWIKAPNLMFTPVIIYALYAFGNVIVWGIDGIMNTVALTTPILSTIYALEN